MGFKDWLLKFDDPMENERVHAKYVEALEAHGLTYHEGWDTREGRRLAVMLADWNMENYKPFKHRMNMPYDIVREMVPGDIDVEDIGRGKFRFSLSERTQMAIDAIDRTNLA